MTKSLNICTFLVCQLFVFIYCYKLKLGFIKPSNYNRQSEHTTLIEDGDSKGLDLFLLWFICMRSQF